MTAAERSPSDVHIRDVVDDDLELFYEHQLDPESLRMAAFSARDRAAFLSHWAKIRAGQTTLTQTIVVDGRVVGNIGSWEQSGRRLVGYWIGRRDWGRGIATKALALFVDQVTSRPLHAYVAVHNTGSIRVLEKCGFRRAPAQDLPPADGSDDVEEILLVLVDTERTPDIPNATEQQECIPAPAAP